MNDRNIQKLSGALQRTVALLQKHGERRWAFKLEGYLEFLRAGDLAAIDGLLGTYGGMGSFNDLYLCAQNGHQLEVTETTSVNQNLSRLRSEMWELATEVRRHNLTAK
jgi:hypothetical protein